MPITPSTTTTTTEGGGPGWRTLASVIGVVTGGALPGFLTGGVSVQLRADLGFGESGLGFAVGAFFTAAALSSAVLGRTAERLGPSRAMQASAVVSVVSLLGVAAGARSFTTLLLWLAVGGVANALAQPAANLFIARTVEASRLGMAFAVKQSGIPAATLLGGLAVPAIALTVGWRWAFVAGAAVPLGGGLTLPRVGGRVRVRIVPAARAASRCARWSCSASASDSEPRPRAPWAPSSSTPPSPPGWEKVRRACSCRPGAPSALPCASSPDAEPIAEPAGISAPCR